MPRRTRRVRLWAACVALLAAGAAGCGQSTHDSAAKASAPPPRPTVTVTATTTVTARPEPGPTVTRTKTVRTPGPTVTVTKAASGTVRSDGTGTGTCSIVSNAGNCYRAGQFCRSGDHGATTTDAAGTTITCSYSGSAWRWTYA
ncbi:hypothetical protein FB563_4974 [Streptomyces puniciscabiei]|uniref:Ig-like domain-containing protein n=1 Tax=Streptomyces puniciscabiei TaxID=164348 RepID=A0A542ULG6_9ACTN|nr:hypothetical protein [Streptomyces puniciscabiei]TQK99892.1 hypothetical protein FB563_4974 [Streptomyces puniciscabiei]